MRDANPQLQALLASNQFIFADLYTFTLVSGQVLTYTDADINLTLDGMVFSATDVKIQRKGIKTTIGTQVGTLEIDLFPGPDNLVNGVPMIQALVGGAFDRADVLVQRVFMASWGDTSAGAISLFSGYITDSSPTRTTATLTVTSYSALLNIDMPRNLYQASCSLTLYGLGCGVKRSAVAVPATVGAGSTQSVVNVSTSQPVGWFSQGYVMFGSGQNANLRRTIKTNTSSQIVLAYPLQHAPAAGDSATLYPGCDHQCSTCSSKFGNSARFRATPYIPVPETAT